MNGTLSQSSTIGSHESTNYQLVSGFWSWLTDLFTDPEADLSLSKSASVSQVGIGMVFGYTVTVENLGETDAENLLVEEDFPDGMVLQSISGTGWDCNSNTLSCTRSILTAGDSSTITLIVTAPNVEGDYSNTATVSSDLIGDDPGNNSDSCSVTVREMPAPDNFIYLPIILK